jgi:hypothetical protein
LHDTLKKIEPVMKTVGDILQTTFDAIKTAAETSAEAIKLIYQTIKDGDPKIEPSQGKWLGFRNALAEVHGVIESLIEKIKIFYDKFVNSQPVIIFVQFLQTPKCCPCLKIFGKKSKQA